MASKLYPRSSVAPVQYGMVFDPPGPNTILDQYFFPQDPQNTILILQYPVFFPTLPIPYCSIPVLPAIPLFSGIFPVFTSIYQYYWNTGQIPLKYCQILQYHPNQGA